MQERAQLTLQHSSSFRDNHSIEQAPQSLHAIRQQGECVGTHAYGRLDGIMHNRLLAQTVIFEGKQSHKQWLKGFALHTYKTEEEELIAYALPGVSLIQTCEAEVSSSKHSIV